METFNQAIEQLKPLFDSIAEKIGVGAEFGWEVVLKQMYVYGVGWAIASTVAFVVGILGLWTLRWSIKNRDEDDEYNISMFGFCVAAGGISLGSLFLFSAVARFINPEYYALQFFINLVGK